jgi:hypothetical protein
MTASDGALAPENCASGNEDQLFTFGGAAAAGDSDPATAAAVSTSAAAVKTSVAAVDAAAAASTACGFVTVTVTAAAAAASTAAPVSAVAVTSAPAVASVASSVDTNADVAGVTIDTANIPTFNPTSAVPVSGAGGTLNPTDVAQSNPRDNTATRALSSVQIKAPNGLCLFVDPTGGDFRENLIPVQLAECTGSPNELFDFITAGAHNDGSNSTLIVSSLTQGCVSFDGRRAANDNVNFFACGGRADGTGQTNSGQLFPFAAGETTIVLAPESNAGTCIVPSDGRIVGATCTSDATQVYTIG